MASKLMLLQKSSSHGRLLISPLHLNNIGPQLMNAAAAAGGGNGSGSSSTNIAQLSQNHQSCLQQVDDRQSWKLPLLAPRWKKPSRQDYELGFDHGYFVSDDELEYHEYDEDIKAVLRDPDLNIMNKKKGFLSKKKGRSSNGNKKSK
ncbi:unnamed protein product [Linum trigynum]|uniref:Uncharacterized protein n=1 Tax=Linum trigynum TaxID=586398 RepID=A0AAV2FKW2_9ROSI